MIDFVCDRAENIVGKEGKSSRHHFLPFPTFFSNDHFLAYHMTKFYPFPKLACLLYKSFENPVEKEELLIMSNFSFSRSVFHPFRELRFIRYL